MLQIKEPVKIRVNDRAELVITEDKVEFFLDGIRLAVSEKRGNEDYDAHYGGDFPYGPYSQQASYISSNVIEPIYQALQRLKEMYK